MGSARPVEESSQDLRKRKYQTVYLNPEAQREAGKAESLMETVYDYYLHHLDLLPREFRMLMEEKGEPRERVVCDYVGAMTDRFAIAKYEEIYIPKSWQY